MPSTDAPANTITQAALQPFQAPKPHIPDKHKTAIRNSINGKLKAALHLMVFGPTEGDQAGIALSWTEAAKAADFHVQAMRKALERPHVQAYLRAQKQVFRASASAQNISVLVKLRDQSGNGMVQLGAVKVLEQIGDEPGAGSVQQRAPGMVIVVVNGTNPPPPLTTPNVINHLDTERRS